MYMQPDRPVPPKNYSGSAFAPFAAPPDMPPSLPPEPTEEAAPAAAPPPDVTETPPVGAGEERDSLHEPPTPPEGESVAASARPGGRGGFLTRFPLLSSFLPPPRHGAGERERGLLPDWVLLGAVALLFLADEQNDILPLLLLLLLWD